MSDACFCDFDFTWDVYSAREHVAKKPHKCYECGRDIRPGERYERVFGIGDRSTWVMRTCPHCLAIREWVTAHVPCSCWAHGQMLEMVAEDVENYWKDAPGLLFGWLRRRAALKRAQGWRRGRGGYVKAEESQ